MGEKSWRSRFYGSSTEKERILRNYGVHVLQREEQRAKFSPAKIFLFFFLALSLGFLLYSGYSYIGFTFFEQDNIVSFPLQEGWNVSDGFVRISQNITVYDVSNLSAYVQENILSIDLDSFVLSEGYVYVDLILNETVVASEYVYYKPQTQILETPAPIEEILVAEEEVVLEVQEETAGILVSQSGFFLGNSTGTYQVDHAIVEPEIPYINNTLTCANGSTSTDVSSLLYIWYANESSLRLENRSTITRGNVSIRDTISCGIIPQNGTSLVAYWPFDEGFGTEFHEFVNNYSGSSNQTNWSSGRYFYAIAPNATNNFTVGNTAGLNLTKNFTLEFWIFPQQTTNMEIYNLGSDFRIRIQSNRLGATFPMGENASANQIISGSTITQNAWTHAVLSYDNATIAIYLNGALSNSTTLSGRLGNYSGTLYFGKDPNSGTTHFVGLIDEVAVYNASLSASEILDHYKKGIVRLSKMTTMEIDTTQAQFANGTCADVNCTLESGNITLANSSSSAYYSTGNFSSQTLELPNGHDTSILRWANFSPLGTNLSLQVRTGVQGDNDTIVWSAYAGSDPTHFQDTTLLLGVDFAEGYGNMSLARGVLGVRVNMTNNDFTPQGKHGYGARLYGIDGIQIPSRPLLLLNVSKNYTIEFWVKPVNLVEGVVLFSKTQYWMYVNASGNVLFNASYEGNTTSTAGSSVLLLENWTHIAVSHDGDNTTRLYINGSLEKTQINNGTLDVSTATLNLGVGLNLTVFNGTFDSFVVYNRTLSAAEILLHAEDRFTNSSGGEYAGELNRFIQYRAFFASNGTVRSPTLFDVSFQFANYSAYVYNHNPENISLVSTANNTLATGANITLNWTRATDLENNSIYYEFMLSNDSNFSTLVVSQLLINNVSPLDYSDDNYTLLVEHFELKETMINHELLGNWSSTQSYGKWGNGFELSEEGQVLRTIRQLLNGSAGSIEFWLRPNWNANDGQVNYFLDYMNQTITLNRSGTLLLFSMDTPATVLTYNISSWNANEWHHIGVSWQRTKNMSLYLDGVRVNRTTSPNFSSATFLRHIYIGSNASLRNNQVINGTIDELRISSVARESAQDLNTTNYTVFLDDFADNTYYWRVRAIQLYNESFDGEKHFSSWDYRAVRLDRRTAHLNASHDPVAVVSESTTSLNLSSNEPVYCEYKNHSGSYIPMGTTYGLTHQQLLNISSLVGNYTYHINCNDTANQFVNTTLSFYVFNRSAGTVSLNTSNFTFVASVRQALNFTGSNGFNFTSLTINTSNNMTGKISVVKHSGENNPESTSTGLDSDVIAFWTIIPDDTLVANLSENASVTLGYQSTEINSLTTVTVDLFNFNYKTGQWIKQSETGIPKGQLSTTFSTRNFGSYALAGAPETAAKKKATTEEGGKSSTTTPYVPFHEFFEEYFVYQYPFARLYADEAQIVEMNDPLVALFTVYFATNTYLEDVILFISGTDPGNAYNAFSLSSDSISSQELSYLTLEYTVDKAWLEENGYTLDTLVFVDEEGASYAMYFISEDEDYYYLQSDVNRFGTFSITTQSLLAASSLALDSAIDEEGISPISSFSPKIENIVSFGSPFLFVFFYTLLFALGFYYLFRSAIFFYFSYVSPYTLSEEVLDIEEENFLPLKNYMYQNLHKEDLEKELLNRGWKKEDIHDMLFSIKKLPQGKLENYIYLRLSKGHSEAELIKDLARVGWDKEKVQKEMERFRNI